MRAFISYTYKFCLPALFAFYNSFLHSIQLIVHHSDYRHERAIEVNTAFSSAKR